MKQFEHTGRHKGRIVEDGKVIETAEGRGRVYEMRKRHGLVSSPRPMVDNNKLPTGFEK